MLYFILVLAGILFGVFITRYYRVIQVVLRIRRPEEAQIRSNSGIIAYQKYKASLESISAPEGMPAEAFSKLSPLHQHQVVAARKRIGIDG